jgi:hypothetical protein
MLHHPSAHRDSSTLIILMLVRPSIKYLMLSYWTSSISSDYLNLKWFQSYLLNRSSFVRILGKCSSPFSVLSGASQESTINPLLFNIFVNDLSAIIKYSTLLLFADDLKIYRNIKSVRDCKALQADIYSVQHWCAENHMKLNTQKKRIISLSRKTSSVPFNY